MCYSELAIVVVLAVLVIHAPGFALMAASILVLYELTTRR